MLTLLGSLLGFLGSAFPQILKLFQEAHDRRHELAILDRQMEVQRQGHQQRLEDTEPGGEGARDERSERARRVADRSPPQIQSDGEIKQSVALDQHDSQPAGYKWVEALRASVSPVLTYAFFLLFAAVKIAALTALLAEQHISLTDALPILWDAETQTLFAAIMTFWFGQRAMGKP